MGTLSLPLKQGISLWYQLKSLKSIWKSYSVKNITNNLRVIRHAWHFYYASALVFKAVCGNISIACLTP
ncbi:DUF3265 domain-containing protein [Vibrio harveyi]|nr:DUF3265 domain-containing protein [Vibrio harveyi]MCQ9086301.1 DUF3265 domain-containing protein [Vibrio harveyi]RCR55700.1 DUF3265 domain-containing protein [Vibrio harveyi]